MTKCLLCLQDCKLSLEHVIPQCLGGRLVESIYCEDCNSRLGHSLDTAISSEYGRFATLLRVKRERGENQPFELLDEKTGVKLVFDGQNLRRKDPVIIKNMSEEGRYTEFDVTARSKEELDRITSALIQKHGVELAIVTDLTEHHDTSDTSFEFMIETPLILRAIAKIAFGFACMRLPRETTLSREFDSIRDFILGSGAERLARSNYVHGGFMVDGLRPLHKIHICHEADSHCTVAYVALFGVFRYTVLLSERFRPAVLLPGMDYTFDPVAQREVPSNQYFVAPPIGRKGALQPKNSAVIVLAELERGQKLMSEYGGLMRFLGISAVSPQVG